MTDPVLQKAIGLRDSLENVAAEISLRRDSHYTPALWDHDVGVCLDATKMLQTLGTEVTRLRETVGCFLHSMTSLEDLRHVITTWNEE